MPRITRKQLLRDNGIYHIMNRGNNKQRLFNDRDLPNICHISQAKIR